MFAYFLQFRYFSITSGALLGILTVPLRVRTDFARLRRGCVELFSGSPSSFRGCIFEGWPSRIFFTLDHWGPFSRATWLLKTDLGSWRHRGIWGAILEMLRTSSWCPVGGAASSWLRLIVGSCLRQCERRGLCFPAHVPPAPQTRPMGARAA